MSGKKLITVFGATGAQGGSVVDVFLNDPKLKSDWRVRGITRDATKDSSKKLAERGAKVVAVRVSPPPPHYTPFGCVTVNGAHTVCRPMPTTLSP